MDFGHHFESGAPAVIAPAGFCTSGMSGILGIGRFSPSASIFFGPGLSRIRSCGGLPSLSDRLLGRKPLLGPRRAFASPTRPTPGYGSASPPCQRSQEQPERGRPPVWGSTREGTRAGRDAHRHPVHGSSSWACGGIIASLGPVVQHVVEHECRTGTLSPDTPPNPFGHRLTLVAPPRHNEQQVGQSIEIPDQHRFSGLG